MHQEDKDLEMIKRRKLLKYYREYLASQLKKVEESKKADEDVYIKVKPLFKEDAYNWLINIRKNKPAVADEILKAILYLVLNGMAGIPIEYELVELLRRKIEGESGKIYVYRRGEMKEFGDILREKKD
ncbi:hypothetical protein DRN87_03155 [Candidatus Geothermarchaeota archaeon]|nr:MAG: hypothetical protein DRN87_03155 [Candidatus Geothermarchaeota archaeon]HEW94114.1 hypothetical protein [Thermoprotei archaeon]